MPGGESRSGLKPVRKGLAVVLVGLLCIGVTAYAFSSVGHGQWSSRLEKGEYRVAVDEASEPVEELVVEDIEATDVPPNVIVSEPFQIIMEEPDGQEIEHIDEESEGIVGE